MKLYFFEKAIESYYYKEKGSWRYPTEAFEQGKAFETCTDIETVGVFFDKRFALKEVECHPTCYDELFGGGRKYLHVIEWRASECEIDINKVIKEEGFTNINECLEALKNNPDDFAYYIVDYSWVGLKNSIGTLTAWVKVEKKENGRTSTDYIEKEFTNDEDFNAYEMAEEWSNNKFDEIQAKEDEGVLFAVDCGVSY